MKIGSNITVYAGGIREDASADKKKSDTFAGKGKNDTSHKSKTLYAGDIQGSTGLRDRIKHRKSMAQNRAEKIVRDAWNGDKKLDRELEQLDQYTTQMRQTVREQLEMINDTAKQKEELREIYGISDEDMEIMERQGKALLGGDPLTEEEEAYYQDITEQGWYKEYKQRVSELNNAAAEGWKAIKEARTKVAVYDKIAKKIHEERLKVHPMLDAQKKAEEVMDAAAEDVIGMVTDDVKEKMDEQQEEREKEAEVIKEEKEAREELLEKRREEDEELEQLMEDLSLGQTMNEGNVQAQMRQQLLEIQNKVEMEVQKEILDIQNQTNSSVEALKYQMNGVAGVVLDVKL